MRENNMHFEKRTASRFLRLALAALCALIPLSGRAQQFPSRPVTLIVPWPPGGSTDITLRALAEATSKYLGQRVIVENRPGAGGTLGAIAMMAARPDGYTITQIPLGVFRIPHAQKTDYDPLKDFSYIMLLTGYTFGVVVRADAPWKTWNEFAAYAKAHPGEVTYGSTGINTSPHLTMEQFADSQGIKFLHIPYKGNAENMQGLIGGHVMAASDATGWGPHVDSGKLRLLVTWGDKRTKRWPNVPTLKELGYGIVSNSPYGIAGPKGMDPKVVKILHDAFRKGMEDPEHLKILERFDQENTYLGTEDYDRWARETFGREKSFMEKFGGKQ
jgi:tripartite-type tricarboxylate transporter receptor subunit TctC